VLLLWSLRARALVFRGERGKAYRDGASFLASGDVQALITSPGKTDRGGPEGGSSGEVT
jgi:hypothetical protein